MWPHQLAKEVSFPSAELAIYRVDPQSNLHIPPPEADGVLLATGGDFTLRTSGNFTKGTPKSSFKIELPKGEGIHGMRTFNLKSMWNDPSQMREAIAWDAFEAAGVAAPRHTYARFAINDRYYGLYAMIEQVDKAFLKHHFGKNDEGNLYKAYWFDIGPADLTYRGEQGADYFKSGDMEKRTYQLKTNEDDPASNGYGDLAKLVSVINGGIWQPGETEAKFNTDAYRKAVEKVFDVKGFLRWASTNVLLGAWDNYWATPSNYYLYNSGKKGDEKKFVDQPYFHWIPWDYDNSLGIDFFNTKWQYADILAPEKATKNYYGGHKQAQLPMLSNLLKNDVFKQYYLDHLEHMLDTELHPDRVAKKVGSLWQKVKTSAYLEADTQHGPAHTGRQFTNHEVYLQGEAQWELWKNGGKIEGIVHYARMRYDSAKAQLAELRQQYPKGGSGAVFDGKVSEIPKG
jgi:hypothetical protein